MRLTRLFQAVLLLALAAAIAAPASATNGYFSHGYGIKYKGLAGAGAALYLSPMAAATNPGGMAFLGKQYDLSLSIFNPSRRYTVVGDPSGAPGTFGLAPGTYESDSPVFYIPTFSSNWMLNDDETMALGLAVYGNGGMNTDYPTATFDPGGMFEGTSPTGVNLMQLFVAPTFSVLIADSHGFGITPIFAWQSFEAKGLQAFGELGFSSAPDMLTNNGGSSSVGYGVRVGYLAELLGYMSIGAAFQSKTYMDKFGDYAGLFAEQGGFDIPANWTIGIAMGFPGMGIAFDVQQILYSQVKSINNPLLPNLQESQLGNDDGAGFGWEDMTIFKTGAWYMTNGGWTIRGGYSYGGQPIPSTEVMFNILAPGVVQHHLSLGLSKDVGIDKEISFVVTRAFESSVSGANPLEAPGQQTITLEMDQWEFGIGFSF
jgi:long-chain fatty acid transport protein